MFWMLLPPSSNAGRHFEALPTPLDSGWAGFFRSSWSMVRRLFAPAR